MTSNGLVPLIRYRDVSTAIDWLCDAFGFTQRSVVTDPDGTIAYAELSYGRGVVMLGPVGQSVLDNLLKQPDELDGIGTQSVYVAVDDVEAHFNHARSAGAQIVLEFGSDEAGDRAYAARDPEGHVWNFGAYSPFPAEASAARLGLAEAYEPPRPPSRLQAVLGGSVAAVALATAAGLAILEPMPVAMPLASSQVTATRALAPAASSAAASDTDLAREAASLRSSLEREAHARQEAARRSAAIREELARERAARQTAEAEATSLKEQLTQAREARAGAPAPTTATLSPPATSALPETTGSLGDQPRSTAAKPEAEIPEPPVTVQPAAAIDPPEKKPATSPAATAPAKPAVSTAKPRPKSTRQSKASPAKKAKPKGNSGNNPFFMYD